MPERSAYYRKWVLKAPTFHAGDESASRDLTRSRCQDTIQQAGNLGAGESGGPMLVYEYKLDGTPAQYAQMDEAIRIAQFVRNKCLRRWMDEQGISANDLQVYCSRLAQDFGFA